MTRFTDLADLKVGHPVKVKGKMGEDGSFMALEISMRTPEEEGSFVGMIKDIDYQKKVSAFSIMKLF